MEALPSAVCDGGTPPTVIQHLLCSSSKQESALRLDIYLILVLFLKAYKCTFLVFFGSYPFF